MAIVLRPQMTSFHPMCRLPKPHPYWNRGVTLCRSICPFHAVAVIYPQSSEKCMQHCKLVYRKRPNITRQSSITLRPRYALPSPPSPPRQRRNGPFCCCVALFTANALQCVVNGEENPQNCPFPLGFRHPAEGGPSHDHRQHAQK